MLKTFAVAQLMEYMRIFFSFGLLCASVWIGIRSGRLFGTFYMSLSNSLLVMCGMYLALGMLLLRHRAQRYCARSVGMMYVAIAGCYVVLVYTYARHTVEEIKMEGNFRWIEFLTLFFVFGLPLLTYLAGAFQLRRMLRSMLAYVVVLITIIVVNVILPLIAVARVDDLTWGNRPPGKLYQKVLAFVHPRGLTEFARLSPPAFCLRVQALHCALVALMLCIRPCRRALRSTRSCSVCCCRTSPSPRRVCRCTRRHCCRVPCWSHFTACCTCQR